MGQALIVSHGSPSDPEPQDRAMAMLCAQVAERAIGWTLFPATLASPGSLEQAVAATDPTSPLHVYPFFMSDGWFVETELRRRVLASGATDPHYLDPLGVDPALPRLFARRVEDAAGAAGYTVRTTRLIVAAHGSPGHRRPAEVTRSFATALASHTSFAGTDVCFVDEDPRLDVVMAQPGPAVCLPFFALRAGHVLGDLNEAVAQTGFAGPVLDAVGADPQVPDIIAAALNEKKGVPEVVGT